MPIVMADVGWWIHVETLVSGSVKSAEMGKPIAISGSVAPGAASQIFEVDLYSGAIPMLESALKAEGVDVYFGVGSSTGQIGHNTVWVPLALDKGAFTFLGGCEALRSNEEMEYMFGTETRDVIASAIWQTGDEVQRILGFSEPEPAPTAPAQVVPGLNMADADKASLAVYALEVQWPDEVRSDNFTLCAKAYGVWGACVLLGALPPNYGPYRMEFTVPAGKAPLAELWLLDGAADLNGEQALVTAVGAESFSTSDTASVSIGELRVAADLVSPLSVDIGDVKVGATDAQSVLGD
jgi:hypothetical protein